MMLHLNGGVGANDMLRECADLGGMCGGRG